MLLFLVGAVVFMVSFRQPLRGAVPSLDQISVGAFLVLLGSQIVLWISQAFAWRKTLELLAQHRLRWREAFVHLAMLMAGKYLPGKVWGVVARGGKLYEIGLGGRIVIELSVYEQMFLLIGGGVVVSVAGVLVFDSEYRLIFAIAMVVITVFIRPCIRLGGTLIGLVRGLDRGKQDLNSTGVSSLGLWRLYTLVGIQALAWILQGVVIFLLLMIIAPTVGWEFDVLLSVIAAFTAATIIGFLAIFAPAGIGVREGVFAFLLAPLMPIEVIGILVVVSRAWMTVADIVLGAMCALFSLSKKGA